MTKLRDEEVVVAATIEATLGLPVQQHDDGSRPSMHDLDIVAADGSRAAVEVTAAVDRNSVQLRKLVNGSDERWTVPGPQGGWLLFLTPTARAKRLSKELPALLTELEERGIDEVPTPWDHQEPVPSLGGRARALGIVSGNRSETSFPGSVYLSIEQPAERTGGIIDPSGGDVPGWVRAFLLDLHQRDVLNKLAHSGAVERHAFILVPGLTTAPFSVRDMLWREQDDVVPQAPPDLPEQVTHVWLMSFWTVGSGLRWSPARGWERFERCFQTGTSDRSPQP